MNPAQVLSLALLGWLTVMILAVGRTLVPMLAAAAAEQPRRVPWPELALVGGLWTFAIGLSGSVDAQYAEWRRTLRELFAAETGLPTTASAAPPVSSPEPGMKP